MIFAPNICLKISQFDSCTRALHCRVQWVSLFYTGRHCTGCAGGMVRARFKVKGEKDFPWPSEFSRDPTGVLSVMDDAGQGRARCRKKAREGFHSISGSGSRLLFYHSISSSGSPRLLVAFSSGAGSRIPHLMSDRSKVVLQVGRQN